MIIYQTAYVHKLQTFRKIHIFTSYFQWCEALTAYYQTREGFLKKKTYLRYHVFKTVLYTHTLNTYLFH